MNGEDQSLAINTVYADDTVVDDDGNERAHLVQAGGDNGGNAATQDRQAVPAAAATQGMEDDEDEELDAPSSRRRARGPRGRPTMTDAEATFVSDINALTGFAERAAVALEGILGHLGTLVDLAGGNESSSRNDSARRRSRIDSDSEDD